MWRARGTMAPWLFRLTAFVAFMCGGALAQHYFAVTPPSKAAPAQEHKGNPVAVLPQGARLPEFSAPSLDSAPLAPPAPFHTPQPSSVAVEPSRQTAQEVARVPRAFYALAPPVNA